MDLAVPLAEARKRLGEVVSRATYGKEKILLSRSGKPVAAIVPVEAYEILRDLENHLDVMEAEAILKKEEMEGTILSWEEAERQLDR